MTQEAVVLKNLPKAEAEVAVSRGTACQGACASCSGCTMQKEPKVIARNLISAKPGDKVIIESDSKYIYLAAITAYIIPLVVLILGFWIPYKLGLSEGASIAISFGAVCSCFLVISLIKRDSPKAVHYITKLREKGDN